MYAIRRMRALWALCLVISALLAWSSTADVVRAEIPAGPEVPISKSHREQRTKFATRNMLDAYRAIHAPAEGAAGQDDPVEKFLEVWLAEFDGDGNEPDFKMLEQLAKPAVDSNCTDAMFSYCYGRVLEHQGKNEESRKYLQQSLDALADQGYDVAVSESAARHLGLVLVAMKKRDEAAAIAEREVESCLMMVSEGPYLPEEQRLLYDRVAESTEKYPIEKAQAVVDAINRHLYPWVWHMASAQMDIRLAWKARGGGWAANVTEEGWKGFEKHMTSAREHLNEAWNLNPEWPESAAKMITVAMAGYLPEDETPRLWFNRAVAAELDYIPAYTTLLWSLMPRWGGSHQQLYALGRECLDTGRFDTEVPFVYFRAFNNIVTDIGSTYDYYKTPGVFEDLQTLADGYLAESTRQDDQNWFRSFKVAAAVRCGRWTEAKQFLDEVTGEPDVDAFARFALKPSDWIGEIHARASEYADDVAEAEQLRADGKFGEAKATYEKLASRDGERKEVQTFFRGRMKGLEFDDLFARGDWATIPIDSQLNGWRVLGGKWTVDEKGRLVAEPQENGLRLIYEKNIGPRFELRGEMVFVKRPYNKAHLGVFFGQANGRMTNALQLLFDDDAAAVLRGGRAVAQNPVDIKKTNTFRIERWDNTISAYVNDRRVADTVEIESDGPLETELFALGGNYWYDGPVLRYEGLEIRKLSEAPAGVVALQEAAVKAAEIAEEEAADENADDGGAAADVAEDAAPAE